MFYIKYLIHFDILILLLNQKQVQKQLHFKFHFIQNQFKMSRQGGYGGQGGQGQGDEKTKRIMAEVEQVKEVMQDNVSKITRFVSNF